MVWVEVDGLEGCELVGVCWESAGGGPPLSTLIERACARGRGTRGEGKSQYSCGISESTIRCRAGE